MVSAAPVVQKLAPGKLEYIYELTVQNGMLPLELLSMRITDQPSDFFCEFILCCE